MAIKTFRTDKYDNESKRTTLKHTWGLQASRYIKEIHFGISYEDNTEVTVIVLRNGRSWKGTYEQAKEIDPAMIVMMGISDGSDAGRESQRQS